jgi:hypothetical protein
VDAVTQKDNRRFRRAMMAFAVMAVMGYIIALVQSDRGNVHYKLYVEAYATCFNGQMAAGNGETDCNFVPAVRAHLKQHREAFAVGEPFLNLAIALTLIVLIGPGLRRYYPRLVELLSRGPGAVATDGA